VPVNRLACPVPVGIVSVGRDVTHRILNLNEVALLVVGVISRLS